jgi:hypothetical protein
MNVLETVKATKPFREMDARGLDPDRIRVEMDAHGYVLIRGMVPRADLDSLLGEMAEILRGAGWIETGGDLLDRTANVLATCCVDDAAYKEVYRRIFKLPAVHALPHHAALREVMQALAGPNLLIHPISAVRLVFPNFEPGIIHAHQDHSAVSGDVECFTAWMPLHDCPVEQGPLRICEGSHRFGLQTAHRGVVSSGEERGGEWAAGAIHAGDLLLFHSLTVHEAAPNRSNFLRMSLDCRFQSFDRPVNPGTLVFTGRSSWEETYADWPSDELKYYWMGMPLEFKPSRRELAELAETHDEPRRREHYRRILERIELLMPVAGDAASDAVPGGVKARA